MKPERMVAQRQDKSMMDYSLLKKSLTQMHDNADYEIGLKVSGCRYVSKTPLPRSIALSK
jgi:hypothetical protein